MMFTSYRLQPEHCRCPLRCQTSPPVAARQCVDRAECSATLRLTQALTACKSVRCAQVLTLSPDSLRLKLAMFTDEMGYAHDVIVSNPSLLRLSPTRRVAPRHRRLRQLWLCDSDGVRPVHDPAAGCLAPTSLFVKSEAAFDAYVAKHLHANAASARAALGRRATTRPSRTNVSKPQTRRARGRPARRTKCAAASSSQAVEVRFEVEDAPETPRRAATKRGEAPHLRPGRRRGAKAGRRPGMRAARRLPPKLRPAQRIAGAELE